MAVLGALIWHDPAQRLADERSGEAVVGMALMCLRRGMLAPRAVVELRVDQNADGRASFSSRAHRSLECRPQHLPQSVDAWPCYSSPRSDAKKSRWLRMNVTAEEARRFFTHCGFRLRPALAY